MKSESDSPNQKVELRRLLLQQRQAITTEDWRAKSDRLCLQIQAASLFAKSQTILAYFSFRQEPDLMPLINQASDRVWGFPRCVGKSLFWHAWSATSNLPLQSGAYGIKEPHPDCPALEPEQVDLILVPAVACDRQGYRLGYGGGFYDRLLSDPAWATKPTIGIVFEFAHLPNLPVDAWDQPLSAVCTEASLFEVPEMPEV
ncbi:5-formyltetrahydrofolate cyclo-ligase [Trichocoleus sp. FACHB-262]|uniref:5-formyltetrahydrofolate cyclo-ligase n=1 Tax=Trichocoleus sp. FACHB-262 TaxID=2692869 RepID=UPI0016825756|nr:5-formyltetrahydrofolate cyclo-ligase [Trichocoleus sp. FACHB-262]MBD2122108.1 5-formyltetrahydrofolate cyclo-ligase [Trichocoleus sp. FACHB-262]